MIEATLDSLDAVPEDFRSLYVPKDGKFVFSAVPKVTVDAFRTNNINQAKELDALKARFAGVDPDEYVILKSQVEELRQKPAGKNKEAEAEYEARLQALKKTADAEKAALAENLASMQAELSVLKIDGAVLGESSKYGVIPAAIPDLTGRVRQVFRLVDGQPVAFEADGKTKRYGAAGTPLTVAEFVATAAKSPDYAHMFAASSGAGSAGAGKTIATGKNPFALGSLNLTEQGRLMQHAPAEAARLRAEAGVK